jgi:catechol 2,3-dioxygenase-like lactoylglutathione lyase family enzyme
LNDTLKLTKNKGGKKMFNKLECVAFYTANIEESVAFYTALGLNQNWRIDRQEDDGIEYSLIGMKFPEPNSSELVLQNNPKFPLPDTEINVDNVWEAFQQISQQFPGVTWIREPFETESGHVAVMETLDKNVLVLVGG